MPSPIILGFEPGDSLSTLNSIVIGVGWSWGTVTMPFTPLEFTPERIAAALGPRSGYLDGRLPLNNQTFYENTYTNLPLAYQKKFWGAKSPVTKKVGGKSIGLGAGKILTDAATAVAEQLAKTVLRRILSQLLKRVSLDKLQSSTSSDATLYGLNGRDTYNMRMTDFTSDTNLFFVNAGIGAVTQASINVVFIGNFPTIPSGMRSLPGYIQDIYNQAVAWTVIADAAIGVIPPGGNVSIISS